ncbi:hypothetical protein VB10N_45650 [Vibrio sp. 10N]|nr:hypothetical protein VB10N_45650 [Vibrio sp. 10N]
MTHMTHTVVLLASVRSTFGGVFTAKNCYSLVCLEATKTLTMTISLIASRLTRGQDLKLAIAELILQHNLTAGSMASCVGCLSKVHLRLAGAERTLLLEEPLEIVSIMGTLTPDHQHIHISVANQHGEVLGGHLLEGSIVDTTAELMIHHYVEHHFERKYDEQTGYSELVLKG